MIEIKGIIFFLSIAFMSTIAVVLTWRLFWRAKTRHRGYRKASVFLFVLVISGTFLTFATTYIHHQYKVVIFFDNYDRAALGAGWPLPTLQIMNLGEYRKNGWGFTGPRVIRLFVPGAILNVVFYSLIVALVHFIAIRMNCFSKYFKTLIHQVNKNEHDYHS